MLIKLFSADLDGTLLGSRGATRRFNQTWARFPAKKRPLLIYNSGRLVDDILRVIQEESLPSPDCIIGGVGTQIYDCRENQLLSEFHGQFQTSWDVAKVEQILGKLPGLVRQPPEFQHAHKSSWYLHLACASRIKAIRKLLLNPGLKINLVYSSARDLDVIPAGAGKGQALQWLCRRLDVPWSQTLVAGDTANDTSMFFVPGVRGILVQNAHPELYESVAHLEVYKARRPFADGVLQGLAHFKVITRPKFQPRVAAK